MKTGAGSRTPNRWLTAASVAFVVLCYGVFVLELTRGGALAARFFNADALFLPALYTDLFSAGGSWRDWQLPAAPYYFPDIPAYFLLQSAFGRFELSGVIYGLVQILALLFALRAAFAELLGNGSRHDGVLIAGGAALLLVAADRAEFFLFALLPDFHISALLFAPIGFLLLRRVERSAKRRDVAAMLVLTFLLVASDRLFLLAFVLPAGLYVWRWGSFPRRLPLLVGLATATGVGLALYYVDALWLRDPPLPDLQRQGDASFRLFLQTCADHPALGPVVALSLALHTALWWSRRRLSAPAVSFFLGSHAAVLLGTVLLARKGDVIEHQRFFSVIWLFGVVGAWPLARTLLPIPSLPGGRWRAVPVAVLLLIPLGLLARASADPAVSAPFDWRFYPRITRCVDETARPGEVLTGVANYWMARLVQVTSRREVVMVAVDRALAPTPLAQNLGLDPRIEATGGYRLVIPWRGVRTDVLEERLRPPNQIVVCTEIPDPKAGRKVHESIELWYYRRPFDPWSPETDPDRVREKWDYFMRKGGAPLHTWEPRA